MKFNQKSNEKQLLLKAVDKFTVEATFTKNEQFSHKVNKNEIEVLVCPNDKKFDLCFFTWKISALFFTYKEKNLTIDLNTFLKYCPQKYAKNICNIILNKAVLFNEKIFSFKTDATNYESNIIFSPTYKSLVDEAYTLACGTKIAKYLQIAPSNLVNIAKFVQLTNQKLQKINKNLKIKILGKNEMTKKGLNLILAVNKGSNEEAKLLLIEYKNNPKSSENVGLVGKGVVFDAGGYCLKPSPYLIGMNQDMAGAAAVVGTIFSLAKNKKKVNVVCAIPLVKNLINQNSYIVHDIYQAYNEKNVEILNTDAEGRLILADAIAYLSKNYKLSKLVSISTLTGLSARYFGDINTPYWSTEEMSANKIKLSFTDSGEYCVNIPLLPAHTTMVKQSSNFADCANISKINHSDSSFAAAFLKEFNYCPSFTHIDIAGTIEYKKYPINPFCLVLYNFVVKNFEENVH